MKQCSNTARLKPKVLLFLYGDVRWGSRWLGLKEIVMEKPKFNANIPQLGWLSFYGCQLLCAFPTPCERWLANFSLFTGPAKVFRGKPNI